MKPSEKAQPRAWLYECIRPINDRKHLDPPFIRPKKSNMDPRYWTETRLYDQRALDEAAAKERAKVVAFLRNEKRGGPGNSPFAHGYANAIEQGAHHDPE